MVLLASWSYFLSGFWVYGLAPPHSGPAAPRLGLGTPVALGLPPPPKPSYCQPNPTQNNLHRKCYRAAKPGSNPAPYGRKSDFADAERLIKRLSSDELRLSFVPDAEQRGWRLLTRTRVQYGRDMIRRRNRLEGLLEECQIKLSRLLSDLLGVTGRRILRALAEGETDAQKLADLRVGRLQANEQEFLHALQGQVRPACRLLLTQCLDQLEGAERQIEQLDRELALLLRQHQAVIVRMCEMPGLALSAAEQILAEVGPAAARFPTPGHLASWVGVCPGRHESAGKSSNDASPKGNRDLRRILNQCAWAAVRTKNSYFASLFRRLTPRLGVRKALWAVAHRFLRILWRILHEGDRYQERGPLSQPPKVLERRFRRLARELTTLGYHIQFAPPQLPS